MSEQSPCAWRAGASSDDSADGGSSPLQTECGRTIVEGSVEVGWATHPYLGVGVSNLSPEAAERFDILIERGALFTRVEPGNIVNEADLKPTGMITAVGGEGV